MSNRIWKSLFSGPGANRSARRRANRLNARLELNSLENRLAPSGCAAPHDGPSDGQFSHEHGHHHHHHHHHHHDGGGGGGGGGTTTASLSGTVVDGRNGTTPIANVVVTLTDSTGATVATATTDSTGSYTFTGPSAGTYTLTETPTPGFNPVTSPSSPGTPGMSGSPAGVDGTGSISNITLTAGTAGTGYTLAETQLLSV